MGNYQIFTDATADYDPSMISEFPPINVISMGVEIGGTDYIYGPDGNLAIDTFYALQREGNFATTSQINQTAYLKYFEPVLQAGTDILYLCFSSGLSGTYQAARLCVEDLHKKYPDRKVILVDTLCAAVGEGFLVCETVRKAAEGLSIDELADWVNAHRLDVCHWFTVDTLDHLRHGGRVSAVSAVVGNALQIKPLLHVDADGKLEVTAKPRGRRQAFKTQLEKLAEGWMPQISPRILIGHGDCRERAEELKQEILAQYPQAEVDIAYIGPVIGAHTGPGMLALIFWGSVR